MYKSPFCVWIPIHYKQLQRFDFSTRSILCVTCRNLVAHLSNQTGKLFLEVFSYCLMLGGHLYESVIIIDHCSPIHSFDFDGENYIEHFCQHELLPEVRHRIGLNGHAIPELENFGLESTVILKITIMYMLSLRI